VKPNISVGKTRKVSIPDNISIQVNCQSCILCNV
jgi:hypothetical protein